MHYLDILDNRLGLDRIGDFSSIVDALSGQTSTQLLDLCSELSNVLPAPQPARSDFTFIADSTQSGLPYPCGSTPCRQARLSELIAFSSIYADQVNVIDPFSYIQDFMGRGLFMHSLVEECALGVSLLILARPLIDRSIVNFYSFRRPLICPSCYGEAMNSYLPPASGDYQPSDILFQTLHYFSDTMQVKAAPAGENIIFTLSSPDHFFDHDLVMQVSSSESPLALSAPRVLSKKETLDLKLFDFLATFTTNDIVQKSMLADKYRVSKVFSSSAETHVLSNLFRDQFSLQPFTADLPFLSSRNVSEILRLRDDEWHHFRDFRSYYSQLSENSTRDLLGDPSAIQRELDAELIKIEKTVRSYSRAVNRNLVDGAAVGVMSLTASVMTSGVSTFLSAASALIGGGHFSKSMVPAIRKRFDEPESIRDSRLYYVWKIRKQVR
jgi:hypothetical protein